jgi:hypothetical protein
MNLIKLKFLKQYVTNKEIKNVLTHSDKLILITQAHFINNWNMKLKRVAKYNLLQINPYLNVPGVKYFSLMEIKSALKVKGVSKLYQNLTMYSESRLHRSVQPLLLGGLLISKYLLNLIYARSRTSSNKH